MLLRTSFMIDKTKSLQTLDLLHHTLYTMALIRVKLSLLSYRESTMTHLYIYNNFKGYTTQVSWLTNLKHQTYNKLSSHCSVLAYMNDTFWIASSQQELSQIFSAAESFFNMANIQINLFKSVLTTNNKQINHTSIIYNNHSLNLYLPNELFNFLNASLYLITNKPNKPNSSLQNHHILLKLQVPNKLLIHMHVILSILLLFLQSNIDYITLSLINTHATKCLQVT